MEKNGIKKPELVSLKTDISTNAIKVWLQDKPSSSSPSLDSLAKLARLFGEDFVLTIIRDAIDHLPPISEDDIN